jgi:hypothetical protein
MLRRNENRRHRNGTKIPYRRDRSCFTLRLLRRFPAIGRLPRPFAEPGRWASARRCPRVAARLRALPDTGLSVDQARKNREIRRQLRCPAGNPAQVSDGGWRRFAPVSGEKPVAGEKNGIYVPFCAEAACRGGPESL